MSKKKPQKDMFGLLPGDYFETPPELFDELNKEFNFTWDACATAESTKVKGKFFSPCDDALSKPWADVSKMVWCNPPYSKPLKDRFIQKAYRASNNGVTTVMLLPAKTGTKVFHDYIWDQDTNSPYDRVEIRFLKGRVKFWLDGKPSKNSGWNDLMIVIFRG